MTFELLVTIFTFLWVYALAFLAYIFFKTWISDSQEKDTKDE